MTVFGGKKKRKEIVCTLVLWLWLLIFFLRVKSFFKKNESRHVLNVGVDVDRRHVLNVGADVDRRQLCDLEAGTWSDPVATCLPCGWEEIVTQ